MSSAASNITSVLKETRVFPPPPEFAAQAHIKSLAEYERSGSGPRTIRKASGASRPSRCTGSSAGTRCSIWNEPHAQWFVGGKINASYNCLDRHLAGRPQEQGRHHLGRRAGRQPRAALPGPAPRGLQVRQRPQGAGHQGRRPRHASTCRWCPSWPSPCWPAPASAPRTASSSAASAPTPSPTATTTPRPGCSSPPTAAGGAARSCRSSRTSMRPWPSRRPSRSASSSTAATSTVDMKPGRDLWWHELMADASADCPAEPLDSEHPLYILYTSGSTGKPKGVLHTTAGYLLGVVADAQMGLRPARRRHLLVYRRHRLGDGPQLHRLRPAVPTAPPR